MNELSYVQPPATLARILKRTTELGFEMASEDRTGALLRTLAASKPGGRFLELGTGTGVATAWVLDGMDSTSELFSIDVNPDFQAAASEALGHDGRLTLISEDAVTFLATPASGQFRFRFRGRIARQVRRPGRSPARGTAGRILRHRRYAAAIELAGRARPQSVGASGDSVRASDFEITPMAWASGVVVAVRKPS